MAGKPTNIRYLSADELMALGILAQAHSRSDQLAALGAVQPSSTPGRSRFLPVIQAIEAAQQYMRGPQPAPPFYQQIGIRG